MFDEFIFLHLLPNKIVIVKETQLHGFGFIIENTYEINGLTYKNQTKMYKIQNGK